MKRSLRRAAVVTAFLLVLAWSGAAPAAAHVLLAKAQPHGDGTTTLTFTFDHGCGESATDGLTITTPAGVTSKSASAPPGWQTRIEASKAVFTGPPIATGAEAEFHLTVAITGAAVGQSLAFPAVQTCPNGETLAWQDVRADAEHPAPALIVTAAMLAAPAAPNAPTAGRGSSLTLALIAVGVLAVLAAAAGFLVPARAAAVASAGGCRNYTSTAPVGRRLLRRR